MIVSNLESWKTQYPHIPDTQIKVTLVADKWDGLLSGYCEYQNKSYYFIWIEDEDTDYFINRTYAMIVPPKNENTAVVDGEIIGWFVEGEADYGPWNEYRASH